MATESECVFCRIVAGELPSQRIDEDARAVAFMDINPSTRGHVLVVPRAHAADLLDIDADDLSACIRMAQRIAARQRTALQVDGINLLQSTGRAASQVIFHFHVHVIPRYVTDDLIDFLQPTPGDPNEIAAVAGQLRG